MAEALTRVYRKGLLDGTGFPVADVSDLLAEDDTVVWVDLCGPSKEQLHELAGELGLHELAVEDSLSAHQRPKLARYIGAGTRPYGPPYKCASRSAYFFCPGPRMFGGSMFCISTMLILRPSAMMMSPGF